MYRCVLFNKMKIIIIGAGYTGLLLGHCLKQIGIEFIILERVSSEELLKDDHKSFALSAGGLSLCQDLGLIDEIKKYAGPVKHIHVYEDCSLEHLSFHAPSIDQNMGYMISSCIFKKILLDGMSECDVMFNADWQKMLNQINADIIIACDGRNSSVAKHFNVSSFQYDYKQKAMLFTVEHELGHNQTAIEKFFDDGMIALLPLKERNLSSVVWINNNKEGDLLSSLANCTLESILSKRLSGILGKIKIVTNKVEYPLSLHLLKKYYINPNILFFGDTLHGLHPIAGQGLNLTISDIVKFKAILTQHQGATAEVILKKFLYARIVPNMQMVGFTHVLNGLFTTRFPGFKIIRSLCTKIIGKIGPIKRLMQKRACGIE